jgi:hypothetical protein
MRRTDVLSGMRRIRYSWLLPITVGIVIGVIFFIYFFPYWFIQVHIDMCLDAGGRVTKEPFGCIGVNDLELGERLPTKTLILFGFPILMSTLLGMFVAFCIRIWQRRR